MGYPVSLNLQIVALETEGRTNRQTEIVVGAAIKVHHIASLDTQSDGAREELHPAPWIEDAVGISRWNSRNLTSDVSNCRSVVITAEVEEATLQQNKRTYGASIGLDLRSKQTMQQTQVGPIYGYGSTVGKCVREALLEIVRHFCFQLDMGMDIETHPTTQAPEICIISMVQAHVIGEDANFSVILREYGRRRAENEHRYHCKNDFFHLATLRRFLVLGVTPPSRPGAGQQESRSDPSDNQLGWPVSSPGGLIPFVLLGGELLQEVKVLWKRNSGSAGPMDNCLAGGTQAGNRKCHRNAMIVMGLDLCPV
jgi:hypothetical protein